tara:strand:+ start:385 stop:1275 length:891 start_codon:yes stop_codon:yes gene_type:complete
MISTNQEVLEDPLVNSSSDDFILCMDHEDMNRCWNVYIPAEMNGTTKIPMIIDLHGNTLTMEMQRELSDFDEIADMHGAIAIFPQGFNNSWNAGYCCSSAGEMGLNDVEFITLIVEQMVDNFPVDDSRIYLTGWSNGCALSQKLANERSNIFAAIGCMSYYLLDDPSPEYSPIPIMEVHGIVDPLILYSNDAVHLSNTDAQEHGAIQNMVQWSQMNNCSNSTPDVNTPTTFYSIQGYTDCEGDTKVMLVSLYSGNHNPYENDNDFFPGNGGTVDVNGIVWNFLSQFSKMNLDNSTK